MSATLDAPMEPEADPEARLEPGARLAPGHTWLGIASFALSMLTGMSTCGLFALVAIGRAAVHADQHAHKVAAVILGICIILLVLTNLLALGLGIAGLAQTERKKLFAVLGTVFASLQIAGLLLLIARSH